ncbi:aldose 1-epimerase [uncultured Algibacter sp.]|uniref:aldose 1-epimerase n=1 Tax=uncultured Algibacter sp. TaxID=298659 RepID=UPI0032173025
MYHINHNTNLNLLEIKDSQNHIYGKIYLDQGASLQELTLNNQKIIQDMAPLTYDDTYASSILFPFANRVKDGTYTFQDQNYQLKVNQEEENNALHGLVYNKSFKIVKQIANTDYASVTLKYDETNKSIGFPYTYTIQLTYVFTKDHLSLKVSVKNTDQKAFPFTLGWHPYFVSENLYDSDLIFDSTQKLIIGDRNITTGIKDIDPIEVFNIKDKQLDDCWVLNANKVTFNTPKYQLHIDASAKNNFLQAYTPPKANTIAIEPTTGVSNSYNNKIGLEVLKANTSYQITWNLKINNTKEN